MIFYTLVYNFILKMLKRKEDDTFLSKKTGGTR